MVISDAANNAPKYYAEGSDEELEILYESIVEESSTFMILKA